MVPSKKTDFMEIRYETYGIPHDCEKKKAIIYSVSCYTSYCLLHILIAPNVHVVG